MINTDNAFIKTDAINSLRSIMLDRARSSSKRGARSDNYHLSLVVECGGMRGIAASGFLRVLSESGLLGSFDTLHGSSAGACAAAYFLAQQVSQGIGIFEDIGTRRVVNPYRILSQPCMVDTDYIVDEVFSIKRTLDVEKIISEPGVLNIITTSVSDGLPVIHRHFKTGAQVFLALKATLRVPGPFENGIEIDGSHHLDGGIAAPMPLFSAIASGATHILIIGTQREGDYELSRNGRYFERLFLHLLYGKQLEQAYLRGSQERASIIDRAPINVDVLMRPSEGTHCSWSAVNKSTLRKVQEEAENVARSYIQRATTGNSESNASIYRLDAKEGLRNV